MIIEILASIAMGAPGKHSHEFQNNNLKTNYISMANFVINSKPISC